MIDRSFSRRRATSAGLLALAVGLGGCTLGPDPERPITVVDGDEGFIHAAEPPASNSDLQTEIGAWWRRLGDPVVEQWVDEAVKGNTDLQAAAARVLEAQAQARQSRATRLPEVSAGASANRSKSSFNLPQQGRVAVYATTYSADLSVAYQLDLFGKLRRTRQSAWAQLLAEEEARRTVLHTVISEVVRGRVRTSTLERALGLAEGVRDSRAETLASVERRYRAGLTTALDLRLARENLAGAEADRIQAREALDRAYLTVDVLLGRRPGHGTRPDGPVAELPSPEPVPLGLPAELLDRRPDLRRAEMQLAAATAGVGASMADLFPSLSLTGSVGSRSDTLSDLVSSDALVYNALANLLGPIFDGGRRRAAVDAAEARVEQATAAYSGAVLGALREVEDALLREEAGRERVELLQQRLEEAQAADRMARERYRRGVAPLLQVLETERRLKGAENALNNVRSELWNARIDLHLALGGDWEGSLADTTPKDTDNKSSTKEDNDDATQEIP